MIQEVQNYYNENAETEWERLNTPYSKIEFTTTLWLINKYFPQSGRILDVGAGPGRYSLALAEKGYEVTLADISQAELDLAKVNFAEKGLYAEDFVCTCGADLSAFENESFDGVLVMGPLYHIHDEKERELVLHEAHRVLKSGGVALIAYINNFGCLRVSPSEFPFDAGDHGLFEDLVKGKLNLRAGEAFTDAAFVRPEDAIREVEESAFELISYAGAESFLSGQKSEMKKLAEENPESYQFYLKLACEACELPQFRDSTEHLNLIVRKQ